MQTILGANGQIGTELARELHDGYTTDIRLVSRNPRKLHDTDQLFAANQLDPQETSAAVAGSELWELLPRYAQDNLFVSDEFAAAFPDFRTTTFREGIAAIAAERRAR